MIKTVSDLLRKLAAAESAKLAETGITHAPTIGAMYEGLTRDLLDRGIPPGLDIRVVTGFVVDGLGGTSGQIDCMVVRGEGTPIPYVEGAYHWHVKDVLAAFEVKKTLFGTEMAEAHDQLRSVSERYSSWVQAAPGGSANLKPSLRAYSEITGDSPPPCDEWNKMPMERHLILHTLVQDRLAPARIILGYEGYKTEKGLRDGFIEHLRSNLNVVGYGPSSLPNLVVAKGALLVKMSGHPFRAPLDANGRWPLMGSSHGNPLRFILEILWTRLSYDHGIAELFGEDLEMETIAPLLEAEAREIPGNPGAWGWQYHFTNLSERQLAANTAFEEWCPVELLEGQYLAMQRLCSDDLDRGDPYVLFCASLDGVSGEAFVTGLIETRLVALQVDKMTLVTDALSCVQLPDGRRIAADDNTGRLTRWLTKYFADARARSETHCSPIVSEGAST